MQKKKWSDQELEAVRQGLAAGESIESLAQTWGRTVGAIESKLFSEEQRERFRRKDAVAPLVPRSGLSWTQDETNRLISAYQSGSTVEGLVRHHQRSTAAVISKLVALNLLQEQQGVYLRNDHLREPLIHWREFLEIDERVFTRVDGDEAA